MNNIQKEYARVWLYGWGEKGECERIEEQPRGIISSKNFRAPWSMWVKIDDKWIPLIRFSKENPPHAAWVKHLISYSTGEPVMGVPFAVLHIISKAEYETDIEFDLFKNLRITRRSIRAWIKRNRKPIYKWNFITMCLSYVLFFQVLEMAKESGGFWTVAATVLIFYCLVSICWMIVKTITLTEPLSLRDMFNE